MIRRLPVLAALLLACFHIPARAQLPPVAVVFFVEWSGALDDVAYDIIQTAADAAKKSPDAKLTVTGFADRKGSKQADIYLSELRAQVVVDALVADGIPANRITMQAAGAMPVTGVIGRRVEITLGADAH
jgi:hypothetical protein